MVWVSANQYYELRIRVNSLVTVLTTTDYDRELDAPVSCVTSYVQ